MRFFHWCSIFLMIAGVSSCVPSKEETGKQGGLLARVHNKSLYASEVEGMIPRSATPTDSSLIMNAYIDRWVKENLMLHEAERNIPKDLNIDKLVRDYRASLIIHNYEKMVVEQELDSLISAEEYQKYYEQYKSHLKLETPIKRCKFAKISTSAPNIKVAAKWWKSKDDADKRQMLKYCREHATLYQLNDSIWISDKELKEEFPTHIIAAMGTGKTIDREDGDYRYFVKVLEVKPKGNYPPLSYIKKYATNFILHNRKIELVQRKKEELFQTAERKGDVEYFTE